MPTIYWDESSRGYHGNQGHTPYTRGRWVGEKMVNGRTETERFADIVEQARLYILTDCGGSFERFAEWGLVRPLAQV